MCRWPDSSSVVSCKEILTFKLICMTVQKVSRQLPLKYATGLRVVCVIIITLGFSYTERVSGRAHFVAAINGVHVYSK